MIQIRCNAYPEADHFHTSAALARECWEKVQAQDVEREIEAAVTRWFEEGRGMIELESADLACF
jgi:hypothetical protein